MYEPNRTILIIPTIIINVFDFSRVYTRASLVLYTKTRLKTCATSFFQVTNGADNASTSASPSDGSSTKANAASSAPADAQRGQKRPRPTDDEVGESAQMVYGALWVAPACL